MIIGCIINITAYQYLKKIKRMYSNFILFYFFFCKLFYKSYISKNGKFQKKITNEKENYNKFKTN